MITDKRIWAVIIAIILLLLLWWFMVQPAEVAIEEGWTNIGSPFQGTTKLHEQQFKINLVTWDDCCEGEIRVEFEHKWEFYFEDWVPANDTCHDPVVWTIKDSIGREVYKSEECSPVDTFGRPEDIVNGVWDCLHPWYVSVVNGCLYPITYSWELTMWCFE